MSLCYDLFHWTTLNYIYFPQIHFHLIFYIELIWKETTLWEC